MKPKWMLVVLLSSLLSTQTFAANKEPAQWHGFNRLVTLFAGASIAQNKLSRTYLGSDDGLFVYRNQNSTKTVGLAGIYLALEKPLSYPGFLWQLGLEYLRISKLTPRGIHFAGNEPETSTVYHYSYQLRAQQLLVVAKLLKTCKEIYHPYLSFGLGNSFNHLSHFNAATVETGSINLTPTFSANTHSAFTYQLGLGVDTDLSEHLRLGIAYQFTDLGRASFNHGRVVFNQYSFPAPFNFAVRHNYHNQILAQLTYLA